VHIFNISEGSYPVMYALKRLRANFRECIC